jgi:MinD superfamily P-loop ATPase
MKQIAIAGKGGVGKTTFTNRVNLFERWMLTLTPI